MSAELHAPPAALPVSPPWTEEWRLLRLLSLYRLLLVAALVFILEVGYGQELFPAIRVEGYQWGCLLYGGAALLFMGLLPRRSLGLFGQGQMQIAVDIAFLALLRLACGGVGTGLGTLLITPVVAGALILPPRQALLQAAIATLSVVGVEVLRALESQAQSADFTAAGVLGLMLFGASLAANAVAQRARRSEALAERVGGEFQSLAELNRRIVASLHTGVLVVDDGGRVQSYNAAAARLLELRGDRHGHALADDAPGLADWLARAHARGRGDDDPVVPRAGIADVIARYSHLGGPAPARGETLILIDDAARLREQAQQIKLAALGRLSANIAHEIRNPLSAIHHAAELLDESEAFAPERTERAQDRRLLDMIRRHSARIERIVHDVLALSRREPPRPQPIALGALLQRLTGQYQEGHPESPRPIELLDIPAALVVRFDPDHLQQILFNLWDNAFTHGAREGAAVLVTLSAGVDDLGRAWLDSADNGPGIPAELRERMFEPFFTTAHQGTGLGLFLTRELCEYNQARIVHREPATGGACFRIRFGSPSPSP